MIKLRPNRASDQINPGSIFCPTLNRHTDNDDLRHLQ